MTLRLPIYLDHQATTPVDPRVLDAMLPYFSSAFGNAASRSHAFGWRAEAAVAQARETLAEALGASPKEIVLTSGATESNNLAILGAARAYREKGTHLVTSALEHRAVLDPLRQLVGEGFTVAVVAPDAAGRVSPGDVEAALTERTTLVSVMAANNEIGTLEPIGEIGRLCKRRGILFHTDAAQAFGKIPLDVNELCVDLLSLSAHKIYGPKGSGALYVRGGNPRVKLQPIVFGGGHEGGLRSGTVNVPGVVGLGAAAAICRQEMDTESSRLRGLAGHLLHELESRLPDVRLNGHPVERLAGNLNLSFQDVPSDKLMMALRDVALSSGSACTSASVEPSHVLVAIGLTPHLAQASIRFGLGRFTTREEIDYVIDALVPAVERLRESSPTRKPREAPPVE